MRLRLHRWCGTGLRRILGPGESEHWNLSPVQLRCPVGQGTFRHSSRPPFPCAIHLGIRTQCLFLPSYGHVSPDILSLKTCPSKSEAWASKIPPKVEEVGHRSVLPQTLSPLSTPKLIGLGSEF